MTTDLIIKIEGKVAQTNLTEFEEGAQQWIDSINRDLQTDDDFAQADKDVKEAKLIENRIAQTKQDALAQVEEIFNAFTTVDKWSDKIRQVRLDLEKLVKKEKETRKGEVIAAGIDKVHDCLKESEVYHLMEVDSRAIREAVKGKKSLVKMREAVEEEAGIQLNKIFELVELFNRNIVDISKAEEDYPGLFPDKKTLAGKDKDIVSAEIQSRINDFKLKKIEAEQREKEEAERKEKERLEAEQQKKPEFTEPAAPPQEEIQKPAPTPAPPQNTNTEAIGRFVVEINSDDIEGAINVYKSTEDAMTIAKAIHAAVSPMGINVKLRRM